MESLNEKTTETKSLTSQVIKVFGRLGRQIKITPKAHIAINEPGLKVEYNVGTVLLRIGIGKNHSAELIMSEEAWQALKAGEDINITTTREFNQKYK